MFMTQVARRFSTFALVLAISVMLVPTVQAAAIDPSAELVRVVGSSDTYVVLKGKKHLLRTKEALTSYERRGLAVKNISVARFKAAAGVRLVHSSIGPRVYLLDEASGQKVWFPTEASFAGSKEKWENVLEITPEDSKSLRNAHVIKVAGKPDVYELNIEKGTRQLIPDEAAFRARNYHWKDIVSVPQALLEGYAPVGTTNDDSNETPEPSTPTVTPEPTTTPPGPVGPPALAVSLTTFAPATFPSGTSRNSVAVFDLKASNGPVTVRSLTFNKTGFSLDQDISSLWLIDDQGFMVTQPRNFANGKVVFTLSPAVTIPAGKTRIFTVAASFPSQSSGQTTFGVSLPSADAIVADAPITGSFPLNGPTNRIIQSGTIVAQLGVDGVLISNTARPVVVGTADQVLNRYKFTALNNAEDILLDRLLITHIGSGSLKNFANFEVLDEQNRIITKDASIIEDSLRINFGKSGYKISRGESEILTLRADVVSGGDVTTTAKFLLQNDYDIYARGAQQSFGITPTVGSFEQNFPIGDQNGGEINAVRVNPGDVLVTLNTTSPTVPVASGSTDVVLATFDVRPLGQALQWDRMQLQIFGSGGASLKDLVKVRIKGGAVIGLVDAVLAARQPTRVNFSAAPLIAAGKTLTIEVLGTVPDDAPTGSSYQVQISNVEFIIPTTNDRISFDATVTGANRSVQALSLRVRLDPKFIATQDVSGRKAVKIGRYLLQASPGEKIRIEAISLVSANGQSLFFSDGFSNLKLGSKTITTPSTSPFIFELKTDVNAASELGLDVLIDTTSNLDNVSVQLRIESIIAHGALTNAEVAIQLEQPTTAPFVFKKSIMVASRNSNFAGGATAKTATTKIGSFTATNTGAEAINLTEFTVAETSGSSGLSITRGYKNLKLVNNANAKAFSGVISNPVAGSGGNLLKGTLTLQAGQTATFDVVVDATGVSTADTLQTILTSIKATGNLSKLVLSVGGIPIEGQTISF